MFLRLSTIASGSLSLGSARHTEFAYSHTHTRARTPLCLFLCSGTKLLLQNYRWIVEARNNSRDERGSKVGELRQIRSEPSLTSSFKFRNCTPLRVLRDP